MIAMTNNQFHAAIPDPPFFNAPPRWGSVKAFVAQHGREVYGRRAPFAAPQVMDFKAVQRIKPSEQEIASNPRARSAILRVAERLPTAQHEVLA